MEEDEEMEIYKEEKGYADKEGTIHALKQGIDEHTLTPNQKPTTNKNIKHHTSLIPTTDLINLCNKPLLITIKPKPPHPTYTLSTPNKHP